MGSCFVFAQSKKACTYVTPNNKAEKLYIKAKKVFESQKNYTESKKLFLEAIAEDSLYIRVYKELGNIAWLKKDYPTVALAYKKYINLCENANPDYYFKLGKAFYLINNYDAAIKSFNEYLYLDDIPQDKVEEAEILRVRSNLKANPVPYSPRPVEGISTSAPEYLPIISADGELCFFTRSYELKSKGELTTMSVENFMVAEKVNGAFNSGKAMSAPFNRKKNNNEGGASITINNKELFFTVNNGGNFDIYYSKFDNNAWTEIVNVSERVNHPVRWDSQPSISSDGKTLFFASYRDSVAQTADIYKSEKDESGEWSVPKPLSSVINTSGNEKSPFIHSDSKTLYFASDKHPGMGGFDIFYSKLKEDNNWTEPVNIGYPINSEDDEVGFFVSTDGKQAYFASNNLAGNGGYDIYSFELYKEARPEKVLFVKGILKDSNNEVPKEATIELKSISTKEIHQIDYDTLSGEYASVVLFKEDMIMTVNREGDNFNSYYFDKEDESTQMPQKIDFVLKKLSAGQNFNLNNILFDTDSYELNSIANTVIATFSEYLNRNPKLAVEIQGHTDNVGDEMKNLELSKNRALAVYNQLIELGISANRLSYVGYGKTHPIESNDTDEGRRKNRRTEIVVISN